MSLWRLKKVSSSRHCFWCLSDLTSYLVLLLTFDLVLTFEICMWPHLAMNSGKSMWKTLLHSCKTEIIRQIIGKKKTCGKNVSFLFLSFHKTDLKVLHRDWHSARSLVTKQYVSRDTECWFLTDYFQKQFEKTKLSDFKSPEVCNSFYIFQAV